MSSKPDHDAFTAVFAGNLRKFSGNPFLTDTAFGRPFALGLGNAFDREGEAEATIAELVQALTDVLPYAQASIGRPRAAWPADSVILRAEAAVLRAQGYPPEQSAAGHPVAVDGGRQAPQRSETERSTND